VIPVAVSYENIRGDHRLIPLVIPPSWRLWVWQGRMPYMKMLEPLSLWAHVKVIHRHDHVDVRSYSRPYDPLIQPWLFYGMQAWPHLSRWHVRTKILKATRRPDRVIKVLHQREPRHTKGKEVGRFGEGVCQVTKMAVPRPDYPAQPGFRWNTQTG